jgi:hypothetical protein
MTQSAPGDDMVSGEIQPVPSSAAPAPNGATWSYVYAWGRIEPRFPTLGLEREFAQAVGRADTGGLTDSQALREVLSQPANRYLARQLCWVLSIGSLETYILVVRDPAGLDQLLGALRPAPIPADIDIVVGLRGSAAPAALCGGLQLPLVAFDQIYSFDRESFISAIPRPDSMTAEEFGPAASEVLDRMVRITDNTGVSDGDRAMNYLAVRYPAIYATAADAFAHNSALSGVEARPAPVSGARRVIDVIFSFTNRQTDVVEKFMTRADITDEFPFLVSRITPYFDRD